MPNTWLLYFQIRCFSWSCFRVNWTFLGFRCVCQTKHHFGLLKIELHFPTIFWYFTDWISNLLMEQIVAGLITLIERLEMSITPVSFNLLCVPRCSAGPCPGGPWWACCCPVWLWSSYPRSRWGTPGPLRWRHGPRSAYGWSGSHQRNHINTRHSHRLNNMLRGSVLAWLQLLMDKLIKRKLICKYHESVIGQDNHAKYSVVLSSKT